MKAHHVFVACFAAALFCPAPSIAAAPGAPQLTVGASLKQLIFDWDDVSGASYYRLMYRVNTQPLKTLIDNIPAYTTQQKLSVPVHLQSWTMLRYVVAACNSSGCTNSNTVFPQDLMLDTIGYFKASNTDAGVSEEYFGESVVLSDDGRTLAVAAPGERSIATGINGDQSDNSTRAGAVYVFRRLESGWKQQAYIKSPTQSDWFGGSTAGTAKSMAISADGSILAVGAPRQAGPTWPLMHNVGAVHVYQRSASQVWSLMTTIPSPSPEEYYEFGATVDLSLDGHTLKVTSVGPNVAVSPTTFIVEGRTHIYVRSGSTWQHQVTLAPYLARNTCPIVRMSGDGKTLVSLCLNQNHNTQRLETRKRIGNNWVHVKYQALEDIIELRGLEVSFDGTTLLLQRRLLDQGLQGVAIYQWDGASWQHERDFATPLPVPLSLDRPWVGRPLAMSRDGNVIAVGDEFGATMGAGVSRTVRAGTAAHGVVYVWKRDAQSGEWVLKSAVKAPNPGVNDYFGRSLSMCGKGNALVVGAEGEDSRAKGVDGDREDEGAIDSGAVYMY